MDASGQEQLYELLRRLNNEHGMTILMVSHDIGAVMREAKMVACINRDLVFHGPPHDLTQQELANMIGSCRETISRAFNQLARDGLIIPRGRSLVVTPALIERCEKKKAA